MTNLDNARELARDIRNSGGQSNTASTVISALADEVEQLTAERDRYREAHYWLMAWSQRLFNQVSGAQEGLREAWYRYSGPEWAEWNPYTEDDQKLGGGHVSHPRDGAVCQPRHSTRGRRGEDR